MLSTSEKISSKLIFGVDKNIKVWYYNYIE